ncbi:MAG: hypothetical protein NVS3B10_10370 [Polyangiales bacterium]
MPSIAHAERVRSTARALLPLLLPLALAACSGRSVTNAFLGSALRQAAYGAAPATPTDARYVLLAGDMHCHVAPPDDVGDVSRGFDETVALAEQRHLDFVVLTPHVASRFFADPSARSQVAEGQRALRATIAAQSAKDAAAGKPGVLFVPGFEYTDHRWGHVGVAFADLDAVLGDVSLDAAKAHPEAFFAAWVARGGTLVIHHPFVTPLDSIFAMARVDLSWKSWTTKKPAPPEIAAIERLAIGYEAYNAQVTHLRDALLLHDDRVSIDATMKRLDADLLAEPARTLVPTGGTDSHGPALSATTWVLATARTAAAVHDAIVGGRVCARAPQACSLEVKVGEGWAPIGSRVNGVDGIDVRARGTAIEIYAGGELVARPESGQVVHVAVKPGQCTVVRARVDDGVSAPILVDCGTLGRDVNPG